MALDYQEGENQMNKTVTKYEDIKAYITKDGSIIRELMHPNIHNNKNLSLAEAIVPVGRQTFLHKHKTSEEIYHIISGKGVMTLGDKDFTVNKGDTICIKPNTAHKIKNTGSKPLKILCCCAPAYSHEDTILLDKL